MNNTTAALLHLPAVSYRHFASIVGKAMANPESEVSRRMCEMHGLSVTVR